MIVLETEPPLFPRGEAWLLEDGGQATRPLLDR